MRWGEGDLIIAEVKLCQSRDSRRVLRQYVCRERIFIELMTSDRKLGSRTDRCAMEGRFGVRERGVSDATHI